MSSPEKNILFITNLHLWSLDKGKGGRAFISTVEGYKKAGWNIWFISTGGGVTPGLISDSQLFEESYPRLHNLWRSKIKIISVLARFLTLFFTTKFYVKQGRRILKAKKANNFVIYAYEVHGVKAAKILSSEFKIPLVTRFQGTVHNNTANTWSNRLKKSPHLNAYNTSADITIMTNDGTQGFETLRRFKNKSKKVLFWRNGVNKIPVEQLSNRAAYRKDLNFSNNFVFLTVSRLVGWKRVERAIIAFSELSKQEEDCELVIIGEGEEKENLVGLSKRLNLLSKTRFVGAIEQKEVSKYMIASDAFLSFYDISNVGNPLMEAMMCAKPIITLDVGDTSQLIHNDVNGVLISPDNLGLIPNKMLELVRDASYAHRLGGKALATAHKEFWNWSERIEAEIKEVESLIYE